METTTFDNEAWWVIGEIFQGGESFGVGIIKFVPKLGQIQIWRFFEKFRVDLTPDGTFPENQLVEVDDPTQFHGEAPLV